MATWSFGISTVRQKNKVGLPLLQLTQVLDNNMNNNNMNNNNMNNNNMNTNMNNINMNNNLNKNMNKCIII